MESKFERASIMQDCQLSPYEGPIVDLSTEAPNKNHLKVLSRLMTLVASMEWYREEGEDVNLKNVVDVMASQQNHYLNLFCAVDEIKGSIEDI